MKALLSKLSEAKKNVFKTIVNLPLSHVHRSALNEYITLVDSLVLNLSTNNAGKSINLSPCDLNLLIDYSNFLRSINPSCSVVLKVCNIGKVDTKVNNILLSNPHLFKQTLTDFLMLQHAENAALL